MYLQIHKAYSKQLEDYLNEKGIEYTFSSVPLITTAPIIKYDFKTLTEEQKKEIYDVLKQLQTHNAPTRHRPWDDKMHTAKEEFIGWWTGKADEEEVIHDEDRTY